MSLRLDSVREFRVAAGVDAVWAAIARVEDYRSWWPWLRRFDGTRLATGQRWRCGLRPPVPYPLRLTLELVEVVPGRRVSAVVSGDIVGRAAVGIEACDVGTVVRLTASLAPSGRAVRLVARALPFVARRGHDRVLDTGIRQFRRHVAG